MLSIARVSSYCEMLPVQLLCRLCIADHISIVGFRPSGMLDRDLSPCRLLNASLSHIRHLDVFYTRFDDCSVTTHEHGRRHFALARLTRTLLLLLGAAGSGAGVFGVVAVVAGFDDLDDEVGHVHLDVEFDEVCEGVELNVAANLS